jgi:hypothetical protein
VTEIQRLATYLAIAVEQAIYPYQLTLEKYGAQYVLQESIKREEVVLGLYKRD